MKIFKKGLWAAGLSVLLGGAVLSMAGQGVPLRVGATSGYWGICGTFRGESGWLYDLYTVPDDGVSTMKVALYDGDFFQFRANGSWDKKIGDDSIFKENSGVVFTGSSLTIDDHFLYNFDGSFEVQIGGYYTFTFALDSTARESEWQEGMTILYEDFDSVNFKVKKTIVLDGVEQSQYADEAFATETFVGPDHTLSELDVGLYGYAVKDYEIDGTTYTDVSSYVIDNDLYVTINYLSSGTKNGYQVDYSLASSAFGSGIYFQYGRNADEAMGTTEEVLPSPGIIPTVAAEVATISIPSDADYFILSNGAGSYSERIAPPSDANCKYFLDGNQDAEGRYLGYWEYYYSVRITPVVNGLAQEIVTQTAAGGTALYQLAVPHYYGYSLSHYEIGGAEVDPSSPVSSDTELTIHYVSAPGSVPYQIDFSAFASSIGDSFYLRFVESDDAGNYLAYSEVKVAPDENKVISFSFPADATYFLIWDAPGGEGRKWKTAEIEPSGIPNDVHVITNCQNRAGGSELYYLGHWDSVVDEFVAFFFENTDICAPDGSTDAEALVRAWAAIEAQWDALGESPRLYITGSAPEYGDTASNTVGGLLARYDYIVGKYSEAGMGIANFMDRQPTAGLVYTKGLSPQDSEEMTAIFIFAGTASVSFLSGLYLIGKKKRRG